MDWGGACVQVQVFQAAGRFYSMLHNFYFQETHVVREPRFDRFSYTV
jgi:hypothetical protein